MNIDPIVESIPTIIASLYDAIYLVNKSTNEFYNIKYTGDEIRVSANLPYEENIKKVIDDFKEDITSDLDKETLKKILITKDNKEKIVSVVTVDNYKLIFIIDNTVELDTSEMKTIIIADDSPIITKFFAKIFRNDFNVLIANDGKEALDLVEANKDKNLVGLFLDLQMPNMNGFEVLEHFKSNNLFEKVPVSIISGEDTTDGIEKATAYGVVDMLQKPFSADAARAIVDKTIRFSPNNK